jgi:hypothetical protein
VPERIEEEDESDSHLPPDESNDPPFDNDLDDDDDDEEDEHDDKSEDEVSEPATLRARRRIALPPRMAVTMVNPEDPQLEPTTRNKKVRHLLFMVAMSAYLCLQVKGI